MSIQKHIKERAQLGLNTHIAILKSASSTFSLPDNEGHDIGQLLETVYKDTDNLAAVPCTFTGEMDAFGVMTASSVTGTIVPGMTVEYSGVGGTQPFISEQLTGTKGGAGTYQTTGFSIASASMIGNGCILIPNWCKYYEVYGHIEFPQQVAGDGFASVHLFRNGKSTPIAGDMAYHIRRSYLTSNPSYTSITSQTGRISPTEPVGTIVDLDGNTWRESISLRGFQNTGAAQTLQGSVAGGKQWLSVTLFAD